MSPITEQIKRNIAPFSHWLLIVKRLPLRAYATHTCVFVSIYLLVQMLMIICLLLVHSCLILSTFTDFWKAAGVLRTLPQTFSGSLVILLRMRAKWMNLEPPMLFCLLVVVFNQFLVSFFTVVCGLLHMV